MADTTTELVNKAHKHALIALICWICIITCLIGLIFQIILVLDLMKMDDSQVKDRKLLLILAIIGIFYAGVILDIIILFKLRPDTINVIKNDAKNLAKKI